MNELRATDDSIGILEIELVRLVRHLETSGRRSGLYDSVDRAGYLVLRTLDDAGPLSVNALAEALHLDASTVTRQVGALRAGKLIDRIPLDHDRRSASIVLTPLGRRTMRDVERRRRRQLEELVNEWPEGERLVFATMMNKLNTALIEHALAAAP